MWNVYSLFQGLWQQPKAHHTLIPVLELGTFPFNTKITEALNQLSSINNNLTFNDFLETSHLATEGAGILGVLADFNLLHHFPKGCTITGPIFTHDPDLLGALGLLGANQNELQLHRDSLLLLPAPLSRHGSWVLSTWSRAAASPCPGKTDYSRFLEWVRKGAQRWPGPAQAGSA